MRRGIEEHWFPVEASAIEAARPQKRALMTKLVLKTKAPPDTSGAKSDLNAPFA